MSEELNVKGSKVIGGMFESGRDEVAIPHSGETIPWRDVVAFVIQRAYDNGFRQHAKLGEAADIRLATAPKSNHHPVAGTGLYLPPLSAQVCFAATIGVFALLPKEARLKLRIRWRSTAPQPPSPDFLIWEEGVVEMGKGRPVSYRRESGGSDSLGEKH